MKDAFAIATRTFEPVDREVLAEVLRGVPGLTPADASTLCGEGCGFLARHLTAEQAAAFHANLQSVGVAAELVAESDIPTLPGRRLIRRAEFTPEALLVDDALGRMTPVVWTDIAILAAGSVRETVFTSTEVDYAFVNETVTGLFALGSLVCGLSSTAEVTTEKGVGSDVERDFKESAEWSLRAELLLADGTTRLSIAAEKFSFAGLKELLGQDLATDFCLLVRELAKHAPQATLNQGVQRIVAEPAEFAYYETRKAFQDETTWLLWRRHADEAGEQTAQTRR
jgi:hypothetical protein